MCGEVLTRMVWVQVPRYNVTEPVAGNYYPVNTVIALTDEAKGTAAFGVATAVSAASSPSARCSRPTARFASSSVCFLPHAHVYVHVLALRHLLSAPPPAVNAL